MARHKSRLGFLPQRVLLDGGMGTALIARGLRVTEEPADAWNLTRPDAIREIHLAFVLAGARVLTTNTFGSNRLRLGRYGRHDQVRLHNLEGARLARAECPPDGWIAGCIGPTGEIPPPEGDADLAELEDAFAQQAAALAEGGVDFLHIETLYHPKEARAALRGCRAGAPELPVVASMTCRRTAAGGYATTMGFSPDTLVSVFLEERADGIGVNCSLPPADLADLVARLAARAHLPIFAQPIAAPRGEAPLYPEEFAAGALTLAGAGARVIGGCCGTGPADLAALRAALAALPEPPAETRPYGA